MNTVTYVLLALLVVSHVIAHLFSLRRLKDVFMRGTATLTAQIGDLQVELDRARELTQVKNDNVHQLTKERDDWHELYIEQTIGHGNAQNLMMGEIEKLARLCASKGLTYRMPTVLKAVREEYLIEHENGAREDQAQTSGDPKPAA